MRPFAALLVLASFLAVAVGSALPLCADEIPDAAAPSQMLRLEDLDLLPLSEFEAQDLRQAHPKVVRRLQGLAGKLAKAEKSLRGLDPNKGKDEKVRQLRAEIARIREQALPLLAVATDLLRPYGLTDAMLETMAAASPGPTRVERYAHHLVLLLELEPAQRTLFERVVPEVDGAYFAAAALESRTRLTLKQGGVEPGAAEGVLSGFRRQTREVDRRFWRLVDYVLDTDQKAALWELLPAAIRRHDSAVEHVYALSSLTPGQGGRIRALVTEIEAESAPDQALVRRLARQLRDASIPREKREEMGRERSAAYRRLAELKRAARDATLEILTDAQIHELKGIPPRVSIGDRRANGRRVLEGMQLDAAQTELIEQLRKEGREAAKRYQARVRAIRKESGDVGPDSPQTMMMEMMMAGARGQAMTAQRELLGRVFLEVLEPHQVTGWVMGLYGYRR